jgi:uncharacterized membrane protein YgcG
MGRLVQLILAVLLFSIPAGAAGEAIRLFATEIQLDTEDAFTVEERITYDFGHQRRHGIFREIPIRYGRGRAADYRISLDVESVTDESGSAQPFQVSTSGRNLRIRIGDPKREVTGIRSYLIRYRVKRGILYFDDHDELYWNVTGTDWPVPIDRAEAVIFLPEGAPLALMKFRCFTGPMGAVGSDCGERASDGVVSFATDRPLRNQEGLTIVVWLPKGVLTEPTALERLLSRLGDYLSLWTLLPLGTLLGLLYLWRSRGRDPGGRNAIPVSYEPPEGMTPAELGTVVDERVDIEDITSSILDLAVRGFLEIEELEATKFLFFSDRDFALIQKREPDSSLQPHEQLLLSRLFATGSRVTMSSLKEKFYKYLPELRSSLYQQLSGARGYFPVSPDRVRKGYAVAGGILLGLGVLVLAPFSLAVPGVALIACGAVTLLFSRIMPRRTRRGRKVYEEILGFKEFVERVDADRLERMGARSVGQFEKLLPYAIVLGVADQWADAFAGIYTQPPSWYHSPRYTHGFAPRLFVGDLGRSLSTMGQTMSSSPKSSGSGGSGFGGGGFSGGGMGGGGGGSW